MYTQCSHCETVFQLKAETLRAAGGQVRCGKCGEVFNALARLAEDASAFSAPGESAAGESALEMEARADEILHSPAPKRPAKSEPAYDGEDLASGDVEFARLQLIEKFKPSRHETPAPPRHVAPPVTTPVVPPRSPAPKAKTAPPPSAAESAKRVARDVAPAAVPHTSTPGLRPPPAHPKPVRRQNWRTKAPSSSRFRPASSIGSSSIPLRGARRPSRARSDASLRGEEHEPAGERMGGLDVAEHVRRDVLAGLGQRQLEEPGEPAARRCSSHGAAPPPY